MIDEMLTWIFSASILTLLLIGAAYFIPSIIAIYRQHQSRWAIVAVNLLFGWTFIGWAVALIWSLTGVRK